MKHVALTAIVVALISTACIFPETNPCTGFINIVGTIPDTTVVIGDTLYIDLTDPPLFQDSQGRPVSFNLPTKLGTGTLHVKVHLVPNPDDEDKRSLLEIVGLSTGENLYQIQGVSASCSEKNIELKITVP